MYRFAWIVGGRPSSPYAATARTGTVAPMTDLSLVTPRLRLRPLVVADAAAMWPYVTDPAVSYYMTWEPHRDLSETQEFLAFCETSRAEGRTATLGVFEPDGTFVGVAGLHDVTRTVRAWRRDVAELGYWIAPPHQGRGYVTEAARAVVDAAFDQLHLHKVKVGCLVENVGSRRVIEKLGFRLVGVEHEHAFRHGRWWDHLGYEVTASAWRAPSRGA